MPAQSKLGCPLDNVLCGDCFICNCFRRVNPSKTWRDIQDKFQTDAENDKRLERERLAIIKARLAQEEYERTGSRAHTWVRIGYPPNDPSKMTELLNVMRLNKSKPYFQSGGSFTIEYYGAESNRAHLHLLLDHHVSPSKISKYLSRMFFNVENSNHVHVTKPCNPADYNHRKNYVEGNKQPLIKQECVQEDRDLRDSLGIEHIYYLHTL